MSDIIKVGVLYIYLLFIVSCGNKIKEKSIISCIDSVDYKLCKNLRKEFHSKISNYTRKNIFANEGTFSFGEDSCLHITYLAINTLFGFPNELYKLKHLEKMIVLIGDTGIFPELKKINLQYLENLEVRGGGTSTWEGMPVYRIEGNIHRLKYLSVDNCHIAIDSMLSIESIRLYNVNTNAVKNLNGTSTKKLILSLAEHLKQERAFDYINLDKFPQLEYLEIYGDIKYDNDTTIVYLKKEMEKREKIQKISYGAIDVVRDSYFGKGIMPIDTFIVKVRK